MQRVGAHGPSVIAPSSRAGVEDARELVAIGLRPLGLALAGLYSAYLVVAVLELATPAPAWLQAMWAVTAASGLAVALWARRGAPARLANPVTAFLLAWASIDTAALLVATGDIAFAPAFMIVAVGAGVLFLDARWFAAATAVNVASWAASVPGTAAFDAVTASFVMLASATVLGAVAAHQRRRGHARLVEQVTRAKDLERVEELTRLNAGLESRVAERTAALAEAVGELDSFAYTISHDLRAPLRAINASANVLRRDHGDALPEPVAHHLDRIADRTRQMDRLIEDVLAFSRLGRRALRTERVEMRPLVDEVVSAMAPAWEGRRVDLRVGSLPACEADRALVRQVWANLLDNAMKFTARRDPAVIAITGVADSGAALASYTVEDNGVGFDMADAERLFGVFQRLHRPEDFPGTGVGLAFVRRIVERHGGTVRAHGEAGRGARVTFTLPAARPTPGVPPPPPRAT